LRLDWDHLLVQNTDYANPVAQNSIENNVSPGFISA